MNLAQQFANNMIAKSEHDMRNDQFAASLLAELKKLPPCHPELESVELEFEQFGMMLNCFYEFEPEQTETEIDPPYAAQYNLAYAYIGHIDITQALTPAQRSYIESAIEGVCA